MEGAGALCFAKDLNSSNRTFLKRDDQELQLQPHDRYSLQSGDELRFGSVRCRVVFSRQGQSADGAGAAALLMGAPSNSQGPSPPVGDSPRAAAATLAASGGAAAVNPLSPIGRRPVAHVADASPPVATPPAAGALAAISPSLADREGRLTTSPSSLGMPTQVVPAEPASGRPRASLPPPQQQQSQQPSPSTAAQRSPVAGGLLDILVSDTEEDPQQLAALKPHAAPLNPSDPADRPLPGNSDGWHRHGGGSKSSGLAPRGPKLAPMPASPAPTATLPPSQQPSAACDTPLLGGMRAHSQPAAAISPGGAYGSPLSGGEPGSMLQQANKPSLGRVAASPAMLSPLAPKEGYDGSDSDDLVIPDTQQCGSGPLLPVLMQSPSVSRPTATPRRESQVGATDVASTVAQTPSQAVSKSAPASQPPPPSPAAIMFLSPPSSGAAGLAVPPGPAAAATPQSALSSGAGGSAVKPSGPPISSPPLAAALAGTPSAGAATQSQRMPADITAGGTPPLSGSSGRKEPTAAAPPASAIQSDKPSQDLAIKSEPLASQQQGLQGVIGEADAAALAAAAPAAATEVKQAEDLSDEDATVADEPGSTSDDEPLSQVFPPSTHQGTTSPYGGAAAVSQGALSIHGGAATGSPHPGSAARIPAERSTIARVADSVAARTESIASGEQLQPPATSSTPPGGSSRWHQDAPAVTPSPHRIASQGGSQLLDAAAPSPPISRHGDRPPNAVPLSPNADGDMGSQQLGAPGPSPPARSRQGGDTPPGAVPLSPNVDGVTGLQQSQDAAAATSFGGSSGHGTAPPVSPNTYTATGLQQQPQGASAAKLAEGSSGRGRGPQFTAPVNPSADANSPLPQLLDSAASPASYKTDGRRQTSAPDAVASPAADVNRTQLQQPSLLGTASADRVFQGLHDIVTCIDASMPSGGGVGDHALGALHLGRVAAGGGGSQAAHASPSPTKLPGNCRGPVENLTLTL